MLGAQIAAGAFDPEHFDLLAGERILFHDLRRRVAAAGVGDALVAAEHVRAINEPVNTGKLRRLAIIPKIVDVMKFHL